MAAAASAFGPAQRMISSSRCFSLAEGSGQSSLSLNSSKYHVGCAPILKKSHRWSCSLLQIRKSPRFQGFQAAARAPVFAVKVKASVQNGDLGAAETGDLVVCFGELLIDFVPTVNGLSLAEAPAFKKAPGGAPANVAVGIARLGGSSAFIGKVGEDEFGYMLADILKQNNVNNAGLKFDRGARTALAFVTLKDDGEREFMFYRNPSADMLFTESDIDTDILGSAKIFHYGSISLITDPCKTAHIAAIKMAKKAGAILSYDPNLRLPLWPSAKEAREGILSIWNEADIIKVSEEEVEFITNGGNPYDDAVAMSLFHPNLKLLLVTEGSNGCRYYTRSFRGAVKGLQVEAIDATGAGDAFVSGVLTQLALDHNLLEEEQKLKNALAFANACGAITVTERGAIPALPSLEAVHALLSTSLAV